MSLGNDWGKQTVKSFPTVYGTSIKTASDCENAPNYNIKVSSYGTNCYIEETRMSVGSIKTTYGIKGVTISMYIDKVDSHFTDNGIESDKIYVFCSRNGRLYTKESSTDDWTEKATISAMIGDTASLSIYGNNNKTTIDTDGYIAQSISTRYSGSYLAASKYDIAPLESNSTVSAWNTQLTAANSTLYSRDGIIVNNSTSISQIVDKSKLSPITPTNSSLNRFNTSN